MQCMVLWLKPGDTTSLAANAAPAPHLPEGWEDVCLHSMCSCLFCLLSGAPVFIYDCHSGPSQRWFMDSSGALRSYRAPTKCLNILRGSPVAVSTLAAAIERMNTGLKIWGLVYPKPASALQLVCAAFGAELGPCTDLLRLDQSP